MVGVEPTKDEWVLSMWLFWHIHFLLIPDSAELKSTNERKAVIFSENPTLHCYILFHPAGEILKHEKNSETLCDCVAFQRFAIYDLCGIRLIA